MHLPSLLGAAALLAAGVWFVSVDARPPAGPGSPPVQPAPPVADGHYVLVVDGDRNALTITHARHKPDPWAGVPKGLTSDFRLTVRDGAGAVLADVPLDVTPFLTGAADVGMPVRVEGCLVRDPHIAMLVNVPAFATAASYGFVRREPGGAMLQIGAVGGAAVRELAGGGR